MSLAAQVVNEGVSISTIVVVVVSILTAVFASITAPLILSHRTERIHREDQLEQYRREDEVAKRAREAAASLMEQQSKSAASAAQLVKQVAEQAAEAAAKLQAAQKVSIARTDEVAAQAERAAAKLLAAQQESIARTDEVARLTALSAKRADEKLDQIDLQARRIHTLVNSDMTAARQSELDQTRAVVVVLRRVIALAERTRGAEPDERDVTALSAANKRVIDLEAILADRMAQMREVEAEADIAARLGGPQIKGEERHNLDASAANLDASAKNLDAAATSLEDAAAAHKGAQADLEVATVKMEDKAAAIEAGDEETQ